MGVPARFVGAPLRVLQNARWSEPLLEHILRDSSKGGKGLHCDLEGAGQVAKCPWLPVRDCRCRAFGLGLMPCIDGSRPRRPSIRACSRRVRTFMTWGGGGRIRGQDYEERRPVP